MAYSLEISGKAERHFRRLPRNVQVRIAPRIDQLADNPRPAGCEKLSATENIYRIRIGDYRLIYQIQDSVLLVLVVGVGHRRDVYRKR